MLFAIGYIISGFFLINALWYRLFYVKIYGTCMECCYGRFGFTNTLYEYSLLNESGKEEKLVNCGMSFLDQRKGKKYKILVKENDHNKVVGYGVYVLHMSLGIFTFLFFSVILLMLAF
ncbi:MAG: hypothetical protein J5696_09845 [Lachnospiraceae bacterium]|nr:hypothetical protein [Lachnospiraceae bacterium]